MVTELNCGLVTMKFSPNPAVLSNQPLLVVPEGALGSDQLLIAGGKTLVVSVGEELSSLSCERQQLICRGEVRKYAAPLLVPLTGAKIWSNKAAAGFVSSP